MVTIRFMKRISRRARLIFIGTATALAALCASSSTPAFGADSPARAPVTSYSVVGYLASVAAVSPTDAWAVGYTGTSALKTLIVHWNGQKWSPVTSPKPIAGWFDGMTEVSPGNIWAVGASGPTNGVNAPLIMHWNGTSWSRLPGVPAVDGGLTAIAQSGNILLTVGGLDKPPMLIMQRIGTKWKTDPAPSSPGTMESIAMTGPDSAWAAGNTTPAGETQPYTGDVMLRWNGTAWKSVSFPLNGTDENLWSLAAGPGGAVWAVGDSHNKASTSYAPISMLWNGRTWRKVTVTAPANSSLFGVSFVRGGTAWAVGQSAAGARTLALHWTGTAWSKVATPNPLPTSDYLNAVSASSPDSAWAVGGGGTSKSPKTFILHWNGSTWS